MQDVTISASTWKSAPIKNIVLALPKSDAKSERELMKIRSLIAGCYIVTVCLVACPPQVTSHEIVKFSLGAVSYVSMGGQKGNARQHAAVQQAAKKGTTLRVTQQEAKIADIRETFDPMLEAQMTAAQPVGFLGKMLGGASAKMIGAWSGSPADCATNRLLFFEDTNSKPIVAWWTQPLFLKDGGLIPSLTGEWEVHDNSLEISFDATTIDQPFTDGSMLTKPVDIRLRLEVAHDENGILILGAPDGKLTLIAAELLEGAGEKWFLRCVSPS